MENACQSFQLLLSAYADGEVDAKERAQVDLHLSGCPDCRARLEDLRALAQVVNARLLDEAEKVDFSHFADEVMRKVTPDRPGLMERLRIGWSEIVAYHRTALVSSLVTAAVTLAVAVPLVYKLASERAVTPEVVVRELQMSDSHVKPVVMKLDNGKTIIMLVHQDEPESEPVKGEPSGGAL
jgi:anti-sigma factor RsiW